MLRAFGWVAAPWAGPAPHPANASMERPTTLKISVRRRFVTPRPRLFQKRNRSSCFKLHLLVAMGDGPPSTTRGVAVLSRRRTAAGALSDPSGRAAPFLWYRFGSVPPSLARD